MDRPWNVLYVGIDLNEQREGADQPSNTDALMLVSLSADQSELTLVSLPRDTVDIPLSDGTIYPRKINGLYAEQGIEALVGAMETLYDLEIDGHVVLDMDDFAALVEAVDGVEVTLEEPLVDPIVNLDLEPGTQVLDADEALGYVRTRVDQDYGRMGRQQEVIVELVDRLADPDTDLDLMELVDGLDSLETDLPLDELLTLLELGQTSGRCGGLEPGHPAAAHRLRGRHRRRPGLHPHPRRRGDPHRGPGAHRRVGVSCSRSARWRAASARCLPASRRRLPCRSR